MYGDLCILNISFLKTPLAFTVLCGLRTVYKTNLFLSFIFEKIGNPPPDPLRAAKSFLLALMYLRVLSLLSIPKHSVDVLVPVWLFLVFLLALTVQARARGIWLSCPPRLFEPAFPLFAATFSRSAHLPRVMFPFLTHFSPRGPLPTEPKITSTRNTVGRVQETWGVEVLYK